MKLSDFKYEKLVGGYKITGYTGRARDIEIPDGVTEIGECAFSWCNIETVFIPSSVKIIRCEAFSYCESLFEVSFEDGAELEEIESHAFLYCESLREIVLPEGLIKIGEFAFANCDSLSRAYLPSTLKAVEENAFEDRGSPFLITLNMTSVPSGFADKWNMLADFELTGGKRPASASSASRKITPPKKKAPASKTSTPSPKAPAPAKRTAVSASTKKTDCSLKTDTKDYLSNKKEEQNTATVNTSSCMNTPTPTASDSTDCTPMSDFEVQDTEYGRVLVKCFDKNIERLVVPHEINIIGSQAFKDCYNLRYLKGHSELKLIDKEAFRGCINLKEADLSNRTSIAGYAFRGTAITHANVSFCTYEGAYCETAVKTVSFNSSDGFVATTLYPFLFARSALERIDIPEGVDSIMTGVFQGCINLTSVNMPESLCSLWPDAFSSCGELKEIRLPKKIYEIPKGCFSFCESLESINLENISEIGNDAFYACNSLRTLKFSPKLRRLGNSAVLSESLEKIIFEGKTYADYLKIKMENDWLVRKSPRVLLVFTDKTVELRD